MIWAVFKGAKMREIIKNNLDSVFKEKKRNPKCLGLTRNGRCQTNRLTKHPMNLNKGKSYLLFNRNHDYFSLVM